MPNYQNSKVYRLYNINEPNNQYIGSTTKALSQRLACHRADSVIFANRPVYRYVNSLPERWANMRIELLEEVTCDNVEQLRANEGRYIRELKPVLNCNIAGRTQLQYYEENKQQVKQYYLDNKKRIKQYYQDNKGNKLDYQKRYYHERIKEKTELNNCV